MVLERKIFLNVFTIYGHGQGQPRVIVHINFDGLTPQMLHTKFQGNQPSDSGEEDFFKVFTIYGHGSQLVM